MTGRCRQFSVYVMANARRTLYVGVTSDLARRVYEHRTKAVPGFTARYGLNRLVYFELTDSAEAAISREKQMKGWLRAKKVALIQTVNPNWDDLSHTVLGADSSLRSE